MKKLISNFKVYVILGIIGLIGVFVVNLVGKLILNQDAAIFFSQKWWESWFPVYAVFIVLFIIGIASMLKNRDNKQIS